MKTMDRVIFDAKVSDRKILLIPVETIAATPYNPGSRTKDGAKLKKLSASVKKYGVLQPLIITSSRDLVDGNRRLAAALMAGQSHVECIILPASVDKDEAFCDVNTTAEKIGGKGWLEACRHGYKKPPSEILTKYKELFGLVGTYGVDMMIERRLGFNLLDQCKSIKSYGLAMRLDEIIIKVAQNKLTNKINAITRAELTPVEKLAKLREVLQ
jgi:hypothetical protein